MIRRPFALLLFLLTVTPALAQTGGIDVCALDEEREPLPGATATLSSSKQYSPTVSELTGEDGCASFPVLHAGGGYAVEVTMPGFRPSRSDGLRVPSGQTVLQQVVLLPEVTERVEVSAEVPLVDLDRTEGATKFDDTFIDNLPIPGRYYQNILTLAPGVQDSDRDGNPNVHGARERNFRAVVEGVANTDPLTGEWLSLLNADAIEEMEVIGSGAGVEFGRASGGFARVVQKQGSNDFEGMVSVLYRSSDFDRSGGSGDLLDSPQASSSFEWLQPAFQVSGPIVKDRLWYRLTHEWVRRDDALGPVQLPVATERRQRITSDQLTWQVSPRNKLSFAYQTDPTEIDYFGVDVRTPPVSSQRVERDGPTYRVNWTAPISPRLLVDSTVAYQDLERSFLPMFPDAQNNCALFDGFFVVEPDILNNARCFNASNGQYSGGHNETWKDRRQRLTVSAQATWFTDKIFGVSHRFELGFVSENERYYRSLYRAPSVTFEIEKGFLFNPDIGHSFVRASTPPQSTDRATGNSLAVYVEDQFKPVSNLAVTLGLRYDREEMFSHGNGLLDPAGEAFLFEAARSPPIPGQNVAALFASTFTAHQDILQFQRDLALALGLNQFDIPLGPLAVQSAFWSKQRGVDTINIVNNNLSPRLSVAWDPWSNGKTKFALTAGRYYDKVFLAVPLIELEPAVAELEFTSLQYGDEFLNIGSLALAPAVGIQTVSRDLRTPYQDEYTFSFEREVALETMLRLSYIRRKYRDQLQDIDINHVTGDKGRCIDNLGVRMPTVATSFGEGQTILDPHTGETYIDTDPGPGDGRIDDCTGRVSALGYLFGLETAQPDGLPDLYVLNPAWTEILEVGNYNSSDYEAFVLELVRRLYRNWQLALSYTWSEAIGAAEDFEQRLGDERNLFEQERGFLGFDQTHVVKVNAMRTTRRGWHAGAALRWESGLPFSILESRATLWAVPPLYEANGQVARDFRFRYPTGRRNDQRNPDYWTLDVRLAKEFRVRGDVQVRATLEVFNVNDDDSFTQGDVIDGVLLTNVRPGRQIQLGFRIGF